MVATYLSNRVHAPWARVQRYPSFSMSSLRACERFAAQALRRPPPPRAALATAANGRGATGGLRLEVF